MCNGDGIAEGACDCDGNVLDCAGECGGSAVEDECGVCDSDSNNDCVQDCAGVWGGSAENCPNWEDNPGGYEFVSFIVAGIVLYDDVQMGDDGDQLAAIDASGNIRGLGLQLNPPFGPYVGTSLWEMTVRSNDNGELISFQYYDASEDEILDVSTTISFESFNTLGDAINPFELIITSTVELSIDLNTGFNWISFNVEVEDASIDNVLSSISNEAVFIASQTSGTATNYGDYGWFGSLTDLDNTQMYLLEMESPATLTIAGLPVDVNFTPIELNVGFNWISYLPQNPGDLGTALASVSEQAIFIASQTSGTSTNYGDYGWFGSLDLLNPGSGYLLEMTAPGTLIYPEFDLSRTIEENQDKVILTNQVSNWDFNYGDYRYVGAVTLSVEGRDDNEGDMVAAFVDGECRGFAERMYFPFADSYMYIVQVYSNVEAGEELTFKYYNSVNNEVIHYAESVTFENYMNIGDGFNTVKLSREIDLSQPMTYSLGEAYPNPFNPSTELSFRVKDDGNISLNIYDMSGRLVKTLVNGYLIRGHYNTTWDGMDKNGNAVASGVYIYSLQTDDVSISKKVILMK